MKHRVELNTKHNQISLAVSYILINDLFVYSLPSSINLRLFTLSLTNITNQLVECWWIHVNLLYNDINLWFVHVNIYWTCVAMIISILYVSSFESKYILWTEYNSLQEFTLYRDNIYSWYFMRYIYSCY